MGAVVVDCEKWLQLSILWGVYNELFRVRGFSAGGLVGGNRIHVVYFSQAYVSRPPGERGASCSIDNRDDIVLRWNPERGKKPKSWTIRPSLYRLQIADLHFLHVCFIVARIIEFHEHVTAESTRVRCTRTGTGLLFIAMHFHAFASLWWRRADSFLSFSFEKCNQATWQW